MLNNELEAPKVRPDSTTLCAHTAGLGDGAAQPASAAEGAAVTTDGRLCLGHFGDPLGHVQGPGCWSHAVAALQMWLGGRGLCTRGCWCHWGHWGRGGKGSLSSHCTVQPELSERGVGSGTLGGACGECGHPPTLGRDVGRGVSAPVSVPPPRFLQHWVPWSLVLFRLNGPCGSPRKRHREVLSCVGHFVPCAGLCGEHDPWLQAEPCAPFGAACDGGEPRPLRGLYPPAPAACFWSVSARRPRWHAQARPGWTHVGSPVWEPLYCALCSAGPGVRGGPGPCGQ